MPVIAVCSLARLPETVARLKPWGVVTLLDPVGMIDTPAGVAAARHLRVGVNDIVQATPAGMTGPTGAALVGPAADHVAAILDHAAEWDASLPLVVHCWAGVSRSTATAFTLACARNPDVEEALIARTLRRLSPTATPNRLLTALADDMLGRGGRMVDAVDAIGMGEDCWEGTPFELPAVWRATA
jgi:predicted protein tyrosine phosphatase